MQPKQHSHAPHVEPMGEGIWLVRVERSSGGESATGEVRVRSQDGREPSSEEARHTRLAGSRAWLALGERLLAQGKFDQAARAAKEGLAELGRDYASPLVRDDTGMKLHAADDLVKQGRLEDGASLMLRMLKTRTHLYASLHKDSLAE